MSIPLSSNFHLATGLPLDSRTVSATLITRDAIPAIDRYDGLMVYIESTNESWQLQGGTSNADWVLAIPAGGGVGAPGGTPTQVQYNNSGAFGGITGSSVSGSTVTFGIVNATTQFNLAGSFFATQTASTLKIGSGTGSTTGTDNTLVGIGAGASLTSQTDMTCIGWHAGFAATIGINCTFVGAGAGAVNTGNSNTFVGRNAGVLNTSAFQATYVGTVAGGAVTTGEKNTYVGYHCGEQSGAGGGNNNCGLGNNAGKFINGNNNIFAGSELGNPGLITCSNSILFSAFGLGSSNNVSNAIVIGNNSNCNGLTNIITLGHNITQTVSDQFNIGNVFKGGLLTGILNIVTTPATDNTNTKILSRDSTTGDIELMDVSTFLDLSNVLSARVATTAVLGGTPTYSNGAGGVGATLTRTGNGALGTIDGVATLLSDLILVKNQASQLQNGLYVVTQLGDGSSPYILTRTTSSDQSAEFDDQIVGISAGTNNGGKLFGQLTPLPTVGTSNIVYQETSSGGVKQKASGTQLEFQIPWWTGTPKQLHKGTQDFIFNGTSDKKFSVKKDGNQTLLVDLATGEFGLGDLDGTGSGTSLRISDSVAVASLGSAIEFRSDSVALTGYIGTGPAFPSGQKTRWQVDFTNRILSGILNGHDYLHFDAVEGEGWASNEDKDLLFGIDNENPQYELDVGYFEGTVDSLSFTGTGLDNLTPDVSNPDTGQLLAYTVIIMPATDHFQWYDSEGTSATNVLITPGIPQELSHGVFITFATDTGHVNGDRWDWQIFPTNYHGVAHANKAFWNAGKFFAAQEPYYLSSLSIGAGTPDPQDVLSGMSNNTFVGINAGFGIQAGSSNTGIGMSALAGFGDAPFNGSQHTAVGTNAGSKVGTSTGFCFFGYNAGWQVNQGDYSVFIGNEAGYAATFPQFSVILGHWAAHDLDAPTGDVYVGALAGENMVTSTSNVFVGCQAGGSGQIASEIIALGPQALSGMTDLGTKNIGICGNASFYPESSTGVILIGHGASADDNNQLILGGDGGDGTLQITKVFIGAGSKVRDATGQVITDVMMLPTGQNGTNIDGAPFIVCGGQNTGSGLGGPFKIYTCPPGSSGTTLGTPTEQCDFDTNGNIRARRLHNNVTTQGTASQQDIRSGTYTPTLTSVANVTSTTAYKSQWSRTGNVVTVSGKMDITPTAISTLTKVGISLPVPSNISASQDACGTGQSVGIALGGAVLGDATNDRAELDFMVGAVITSQPWYYHFTYEVI